MAVQTTTTTANRSHIVEGLDGFVSMRTSIALRRGGWSCRIGANLVVGLFTGEASGFFGSGVTWWISCGRSLFTVQTCPHWERRYTRWTVRDRGHGWGTTQHPSEMTVALSGNPPSEVRGESYGAAEETGDRSHFVLYGSGDSRRGIRLKGRDVEEQPGWSLCKPKICPQQGQP